MLKSNMLRFLNKIFGIVVIACLVMIPSTAHADAEADYLKFKEDIAPLLQEGLTNKSAFDCQSTLVNLADLELYHFLMFLDQHFQNKSDNSSLTNIAIARYANYKLALEDNMAKLTPGGKDSTSSNFASEISAYADCKEINDSYIEVGKDKLLERIKNTSAQKKTTIMVEKYKAINDQLRELNLSISKMYGYFKAFSDKLPGFLRECIGSG
jgi:hypothetical protein